MRITEFPLMTKYTFISDMHIDDHMNVAVDTAEFDRFMILLEKHGLTRDKLDFTKYVEGNSEIVFGVSIADFLHTDELKYDILTFLMQTRD